MANNKSAKKRIKINERNKRQNKYYKNSSKTLIKIFLSKLESYETSKENISREELKKILNSIYSFLDKGIKRNVFSRNQVTRQKLRLSKKLRSI